MTRVGWRFHRIWSSEWFHQKDEAIKRLLLAYQLAVNQSDQDPQREAVLLRQTAPQAADSFIEQGGRTAPRPNVPRGSPIDQYSTAQLTRLIRWIESDGHLRTEQELLDETAKELGYRRKGYRIVGRLTSVIRRVRRQS